MVSAASVVSWWGCVGCANGTAGDTFRVGTLGGATSSSPLLSLSDTTGIAGFGGVTGTLGSEVVTGTLGGGYLTGAGSGGNRCHCHGAA